MLWYLGCCLKCLEDGAGSDRNVCRCQRPSPVYDASAAWSGVQLPCAFTFFLATSLTISLLVYVLFKTASRVGHRSRTGFTISVSTSPGLPGIQSLLIRLSRLGDGYEVVYSCPGSQVSTNSTARDLESNTPRLYISSTKTRALHFETTTGSTRSNPAIQQSHGRTSSMDIVHCRESDIASACIH